MATGARASDAQMLVTLMLHGQLCGIPVLAVRDVLGAQTITPIPLAPQEVAGGLNLRGRIVTAIDLRTRLCLPPPPEGAARMSVVTEQGGELYALLVDQVREVMTLPAESFETTPPTLPPAWAAHSAGVYRLESGLLVLLDVARLLAIGGEA
jgi:purine-binding chemotaxis protein CheW